MKRCVNAVTLAERTAPSRQNRLPRFIRSKIESSQPGRTPGRRGGGLLVSRHRRARAGCPKLIRVFSHLRFFKRASRPVYFAAESKTKRLASSGEGASHETGDTVVPSGSRIKAQSRRQVLERGGGIGCAVLRVFDRRQEILPELLRVDPRRFERLKKRLAVSGAGVVADLPGRVLVGGCGAVPGALTVWPPAVGGVAPFC